MIIFLGVLIYNEILIINACGLALAYLSKKSIIENDFASINRYSIMSENNDQRESVTRMTNGPLELTQKWDYYFICIYVVKFNYSILFIFKRKNTFFINK